MGILFGAVADDDTGATDLAGMLADRGVRAVLAIDPPTPEQLSHWAASADALIIGTGARSIAVQEAYDRTRTAVQLLRTLQPRTIAIKYCSTFDSTPQGNIGPTLDAALDELDEQFVTVLPALPVNGRTTYQGHHFVHEQLLSDSPMRHHPLTPMTNPNLVTHLQSQTRRKVGLASLNAVRGGPTALRERFDALQAAGIAMAVVDCTHQDDLQTIGGAIADHALISGSSAPAMVLPAIWQERGWLVPVPKDQLLPRMTDGGKGVLVAAGSCSQATRGQNQWVIDRRWTVITLDGIKMAQGEVNEPQIRAAVTAELAADQPVLLGTSATPEELQRVHAWARAQGLTEIEAGDRIAQRLAVLVQSIITAHRPLGLIVAGGETSGAVSRTLRFGALQIGPNIDPGVPLCLSMNEQPLPVVLKSGNFGGVDFYAKAANAIRALYAAQ